MHRATYNDAVATRQLLGSDIQRSERQPCPLAEAIRIVRRNDINGAGTVRIAGLSRLLYKPPAGVVGHINVVTFVPTPGARACPAADATAPHVGGGDLMGLNVHGFITTAAATRLVAAMTCGQACWRLPRKAARAVAWHRPERNGYSWVQPYARDTSMPSHARPPRTHHDGVIVQVGTPCKPWRQGLRVPAANSKK